MTVRPPGRRPSTRERTDPAPGPPAPLTPDEIASCEVFGPDDAGGEARWRPPDAAGPVRPGSVLDRLADVLLPALARPPCLVSFSGGMDSAFVLAAAAATARGAGLPDPVPITWRFTGAPRADESARQDAVLDALRIGERMVLAAGDDLDLVGPVATDLLTRFGLRYPANLHLHLPLLAAARGGSLLTGIGGDQVLRGHLAHRPVPRRLALAIVPPRLLAPAVRRRRGLFPWVRASLAHRRTAEWIDEVRRRPAAGWPRMRYRVDTRAMALNVQALRDMADAADAMIVHPFLDRPVQAELARIVDRHPGIRRPGLLTAAAAGRLPPIVTERHPKANLREVFVRAATTEFVGRPVDPDLLPPGVDPVALRRFWATDRGPTATGLVLQHLWLAERSGTEGPFPAADLVRRPAVARGVAPPSAG